MKVYSLRHLANKNKQHTIDLDGSKSISNRLLILNEISKQRIKIKNLSQSDDAVLMQQFLSQFHKKKTTECFEFNVQNAGTVSRFVTAFLATQQGNFRLICSEEMKRRPIQILIDALIDLGADIKYLEQDGFLPILIHGKKLNNNKVKIKAGISSQYISALMMIAPCLKNGLHIQLIGEIASKPYLEITQKLMHRFGYQVDFKNQNIIIQPKQNKIQSNIILNESDWSAAAFYYTICSIYPNLSVQLRTLNDYKNSPQGDAKASILFQNLGVNTVFKNESISLNNCKPIEMKQEVNFLSIPDMVPAYSVACATHGVRLKLTGVRNLVIKESNRLVALKNEFEKIGVTLKQINHDVWEQTGKIDSQKISRVILKTYEDHRIAMAFACLGFKYEQVQIENPDVVSKSYPNFWGDMKHIGLKIEERKI